MLLKVKFRANKNQWYKAEGCFIILLFYTYLSSLLFCVEIIAHLILKDI